jgi:hypothetical protein
MASTTRSTSGALPSGPVTMPVTVPSPIVCRALSDHLSPTSTRDPEHDDERELYQ